MRRARSNRIRERKEKEGDTTNYVDGPIDDDDDHFAEEEGEDVEEEGDITQRDGENGWMDDARRD